MSTAASGTPAAEDSYATRRSTTSASTGPGTGSSPRITESRRSTLTKSASRGTASSASSWAVRVTSRVVPIRVPASFSRTRRRRTEWRSLPSNLAAPTPTTSPVPGSWTGHSSTIQARRRTEAIDGAGAKCSYHIGLASSATRLTHRRKPSPVAVGTCSHQGIDAQGQLDAMTVPVPEHRRTAPLP